MGDKIHIRESADADIPAIQAIYADAVRHGTASFELTPPDIAEMRARRDNLLQGGHPYLVAEIGNQLAGYAYAGPFRTRPAFRYTVETTVYVRADAQKRGVGRALLRALVTAAQAGGFRQMIAIVGDSANVGSVALHVSEGFEIVGSFRDVGWKHDIWLDTVMLQRPLGSGATTRPE